MRRGGRRLARAARTLVAAVVLAAAGRSTWAQTPDALPRGAVRVDVGRFTAVAFPPDLPLARSLLADAARRDTFPGLPRPRARVVVAVAPDARTFRRWGGAGAPEWGAAFAFPAEHRIVVQGRAAGSDAGDPVAVFRHELAHLALHEALGDLPPRWFDEGYASLAAGEIERDDVLATNVALLTRGVSPLGDLDALFAEGAGAAQYGYALAYRAVADLEALDRDRGLALFFRYWRATSRFDAAVRQAYGLTADTFEARWRAGTRRRYGTLVVVANLSLVSAIAGLFVVPVWLRRRRRDRERLAAMRAADDAADRAAARAARPSALDALLDGGERPA